MLVEELKEEEIQKIGQAFAYYDYGEEKGLVSCFRNKEAAATYINGFVHMALKGKFLYATSEKGEAYIAYRASDEKLGFRAVLELTKALFKSMNFRELTNFIKTMSKTGSDLKDRMNKQKKPYIHSYVVCDWKVSGTGIYEKSYGNGF